MQPAKQAAKQIIDHVSDQTTWNDIMYEFYVHFTDVRELIFQSHRIIYLIRPENISIITVIHGSRDLAGMR